MRHTAAVTLCVVLGSHFAESSCNFGELQHGKSHGGTNYNSFPAESVEQCQTACCVDSGHCESFTFTTGERGGTHNCSKGTPCCWLSHGSQGKFVDNDRCTSGELLTPTVPAVPPARHMLALLIDDYGWADAGWHVKGTAVENEVQTANLDRLVAEGIDLERNYAYACCAPTRAAAQTGRNPLHVNAINMDPLNYNPKDNVSGFMGAPRLMTGIADVLKKAGAKTHFFGKWDVGMATFDHTPRGRGYDTSLSYFHHMVNYYTSTFPNGNGATDFFPACRKIQPGYRPVDLWIANASYEGPARGANNSILCNEIGSFDLCGGDGEQCPPYPGYPGREITSCRYEDEIFRDALLAEIEAHDVSKPFFAFWAPHVVHTPLMVPKIFYEKFSNISDWRRRRYLAMVHYIDAAVGAVVAMLKARGMYENTLIVMSSDNGGPIYSSGSAGASNYPLRGGKFSNWEGGIRVNGFASGGLIPPPMRGRKLSGLTTVWDWYATLADAIGVVNITDEKSAAAGLPPVDSISQWAYWSGATDLPPRQSLSIGNPTVGNVQGVILDKGEAGLWKLLTGTVPADGYSTLDWPNPRSGGFPSRHCGDGCLFRIDIDPTENSDVAANHSDILAELATMRDAAQQTVFMPDRGPQDPQSCVAALERYGGFWGPWVDLPSASLTSLIV